jgi:outer membrane translocation and assembly module TamA
MSFKQFTLTIKATDLIESVPKRSRSKFVSDAIISYAKKKGIMDEYITTSRPKIPPEKIAIEAQNSIKTSESYIKKKVKVDSDF